MITPLRDPRLGRSCHKKTGGTFRVVFISDSNGLAYAVRHWEHTPLLLEQSLNRYFVDKNVEVHSICLGGWGFQHYSVIADAVLDEIQPDLVLFFVCANDSEIVLVEAETKSEMNEKLWGEESPLVKFIFTSGRRIAKRLQSVDVMIFSTALSDAPPLPRMNACWKQLASEHGWLFATSQDSFGNLPRERLAATKADGHPSPYVHHVFTTGVCRHLSETIYRGASTNHINVEDMIAPLLHRLDDVSVESMAFQAELFRIFDLLGQKSQQLERSLWAEDASGQAAALRATQLAIGEFTNQYLHQMGTISETLDHERHAIPMPTCISLDLVASKLLTVEAMDYTLGSLSESDLVELEPLEGAPVGEIRDMRKLLSDIRILITQLQRSCGQLQLTGWQKELEQEALFDAPPGIRTALVGLYGRLGINRSDRLFRIQSRKDELAGLVRRAIEVALRAVKRHSDLIDKYRSRDALQAVMQPLVALAPLMHSLNEIVNANQTSFQNIGYQGQQYWRWRDSPSVADAPHWRMDINIKTPNTSPVGLWIESVLPYGDLITYQFVSDATDDYVFTFPFTYQFTLKIAGSLEAANVSNCKLTAHPSGVEISISEWSQTAMFYRTRDVIRVSPEQLSLVKD